MPIKLGNNSIGAINIGMQGINKVFIGSQLVFGSSGPTPTDPPIPIYFNDFNIQPYKGVDKKNSLLFNNFMIQPYKGIINTTDVLTDGLVGVVEFNGDFTSTPDSSLFKYPGSGYPDPSDYDWTTGKFGTCFDSDIKRIAQIDPVHTSDYIQSAILWFNKEALSPPSGHPLQPTSTSIYGVEDLDIAVDSSGYMVMIPDRSGAGTTLDVSINLDEWYLLALTIEEGTGDTNVYLNGDKIWNYSSDSSYSFVKEGTGWGDDYYVTQYFDSITYPTLFDRTRYYNTVVDQAAIQYIYENNL